MENDKKEGQAALGQYIKVNQLMERLNNFVS